MSRHALNPLDPALDVIVGWDPPLQTYFAQVVRPAPPRSDEEDTMIVWRGFGRMGGDEIHDLRVIRELVAPYVSDFPEAVQRQLVLDRGLNRGAS